MQQRNFTGLLAAAVIVVGALSFFVVKQSTAPSEVAEDTTTGTDAGAPTTSAGYRVGDNAVYAPDQQPGATITASLVVLKAPGFVAVHADANGQPGAILGVSALVPEGESSDVVVTLNREVENGERLYAMLHTDDGDGSFSATTDRPVTDGDGNATMMIFTISTEAELPIEVSI